MKRLSAKIGLKQVLFTVSGIRKVELSVMSFEIPLCAAYWLIYLHINWEKNSTKLLKNVKFEELARPRALKIPN